MSNPFNARKVLTGFVCKEDTIPSLQVVRVHVFPLLDLRARGGVQQLACAVVVHVLYEGRAIELLRRKALQKSAVAVV